jgi:hypothetical protein
MTTAILICMGTVVVALGIGLLRSWDLHTLIPLQHWLVIMAQI